MDKKRKAKRKAWRKKIEDWKASGLSVQNWCAENKENYHRFHYWRQALKKRPHVPLFEELKDENTALDIELYFGELKITFPKGCTKDLLELCLKCLRDLPC